jgi:hypothetical protein
MILMINECEAVGEMRIDKEEMARDLAWDRFRDAAVVNRLLTI